MGDNDVDVSDGILWKAVDHFWLVSVWSELRASEWVDMCGMTVVGYVYGGSTI